MAKKRLRIVLAQEEENPILSSEQGIRSNLVYHALLEKTFFIEIKESKILWSKGNSVMFHICAEFINNLETL